MSPDPLQSLNLLDKWLSEHGSAAIQKVHIELLRDTLRMLNDHNSQLKARVAELERNEKVLRETTEQLHVRNKELEASVKDEDEEILNLDEIEVRILQLLASSGDNVQLQALKEAVALSRAKIDFHIDRLESCGAVHHNDMSIFGNVVRITPTGRAFLAEHGFLE